jgi:hypothetical protein
MPSSNGDFVARVGTVRDRMDQLQVRMAELSERQNRFLQALAIRELEAQKRRLEVYQVQARYELAAIYDKASQAAPRTAP